MVNEVIQMQEICFCYVNRKSVKHLWIENGILQEIKLVVLYKELNMWMKYYDTYDAKGSKQIKGKEETHASIL